MPITDKLLAIAFSLLILLQAYAVRRFVGTWLFPACLFGLFWFGMTFLPLVVLFSVPVDPYAVGFIFICILAFSVASLFFDWKTAFRTNAQKKDTVNLIYDSSFLKAAFYIATILAVVLTVVNELNQGFSVSDLIFNLLASAHAYRHLTVDEINTPLVERFSNVFSYLGAIIGGLRFSCVSGKGARRGVVSLSFLSCVLLAITQSSKWQLFLSIALFYAGTLVYRVSSGNLYLLERGKLKSLLLYVTALILIVTVSFMSRGLYGLEDSDLITHTLLFYFASYSCGHMYAFSDWFSFFTGGHSEIGYAHVSPSHGFYTFATLFKMMGSTRVLPLGVFDDFYVYGDFLSSNIYTFFRGLILDFGFIGSVLLMFGLGMLFHGSFYSMLRSRRPVFTVAIFVFMGGYFYSSFVTSIFGVNIVYYVTFALTCVVLYINDKVARPFPAGSNSLEIGRQLKAAART